jgi:hypothetical protein
MRYLRLKNLTREELRRLMGVKPSTFRHRDILRLQLGAF